MAAHPTWSVSNSVPFTFGDDPGLWIVDNVHLSPTATTGGGKDKKDDSKKGGWRSMTRGDGLSFKNQGDFIQWVNPGE